MTLMRAGVIRGFRDVVVEQVPVPEWAFAALDQPVEKRNFRYADMLYPNGRFKNHWRPGQSVPDVSRMC